MDGEDTAVAGRDPVPLLARQAAVLRDEAALLESLSAEALPDPADARRQAIVALGNAVKRQALVLGYSDTFLVIAIVLVLAAIAIMFTRKTKVGSADGAH